jgi:hypothetical protein
VSWQRVRAFGGAATGWRAVPFGFRLNPAEESRAPERAGGVPTYLWAGTAAPRSPSGFTSALFS